MQIEGVNGLGDSGIFSGMLQRELTSLAAELHTICLREDCGALRPYFARHKVLLSPRDGSPSSPATVPPTNEDVLKLLSELVQISRELIRLGYHDVALHSAEIAVQFNMGWDAQLVRAYLLALLGETQDAEELYMQALAALNRLPEADLALLEELVLEHPEEEDLAELLQRVRAAA
jgi:hypothetical protein